MKTVILAMAAVLCWTSAAGAQSYDPAPWLADLAQARSAFHDKYANLEWLQEERELDLDALFEDSARRLQAASDDAAARAVFDRIVRRVNDGHVAIRWPSPKPAPGKAAEGPAPAPSSPCAGLGYDARQGSPGVTRRLAGYQPLAADAGNAFPAGTVSAGGRRVGVVRIGVFQPQGYPALCEAAVAALKIPPAKPCDERCADDIITWAYARLTSQLEDRMRQLKTAGAQVLLVDIAENGGGSEWAEAAARIVSRRPLESARLGFVRGPHWTKTWSDLLVHLREARAGASLVDQRRLDAWIAEAEAAKTAAASCAERTCPRLARAGYATGLLASAKSGAFDGRPWAVRVFSISQHAYHDGVWAGPVIVLVDQETWSAAEQFTAVLQDNGAAVVLGARTGGAGCGHTNGGTPTTLKHSGAVLQLPDCARFRRDGSNEVNGVIPDVLTPTRYSDGERFKAAQIAAKLPEAIERAIALDAR